MIKGKNVWCAVPACTKKFNLEKRYFFRFPKEHVRWLQWIRACGRLDLESKGPEYAYQNCRLCHLHFKEKWYKINKMRARLHPDAIPTIFFGPECGKSTSKRTKQDMKSSDDSPRKNKLRAKLAKLKAQNKTLREIIRRLHLKAKKKNIRD
ncbi:52 kDa repressor of the inhibitor of the protein kinase [Atta colombica]|uniref:52 kDa repressor of the inhibitor of the protein kinase n=1 Tax=Atta colombica TaxID=520822 RepID=A0A195BAF2_9HYME|nr:52 kDa repressor of the inhibitor of the protein kinase [Atta colombica]